MKLLLELQCKQTGSHLISTATVFTWLSVGPFMVALYVL